MKTFALLLIVSLGYATLVASSTVEPTEAGEEEMTTLEPTEK